MALQDATLPLPIGTAQTITWVQVDETDAALDFGPTDTFGLVLEQYGAEVEGGDLSGFLSATDNRLSLTMEVDDKAALPQGSFLGKLYVYPGGDENAAVRRGVYLFDTTPTAGTGASTTGVVEVKVDGLAVTVRVVSAAEALAAVDAAAAEALADIEAARVAAIAALDEPTAEAIAAIDAAADAGAAAVVAARDAALTAITAAQDTASAAVQAQGVTSVAAVTSAQATATAAITAAQTTATTAITNAQTSALAALEAAGATQAGVVTGAAATAVASLVRPNWLADELTSRQIVGLSATTGTGLSTASAATYVFEETATAAARLRSFLIRHAAVSGSPVTVYLMAISGSGASCTNRAEVAVTFAVGAAAEETKAGDGVAGGFAALDLQAGERVGINVPASFLYYRSLTPNDVNYRSYLGTKPAVGAAFTAGAISSGTEFQVGFALDSFDYDFDVIEDNAAQAAAAQASLEAAGIVQDDLYGITSYGATAGTLSASYLWHMPYAVEAPGPAEQIVLEAAGAGSPVLRVFGEDGVQRLSRTLTVAGSGVQTLTPGAGFTAFDTLAGDTFGLDSGVVRSQTGVATGVDRYATGTTTVGSGAVDADTTLPKFGITVRGTRQVGTYGDTIDDHETRLDTLEAQRPAYFGREKLKAWFASLAKIRTSGATGVAVLMLIMDSWGERNEIHNALQALLQGVFGDAGSGWIHFGTSNTSYVPLGVTLTRSGSGITILDQTASDLGPDGWGVQLASGGSVSVADSFKTANLLYRISATAGSFRYKIDSGSWTTVDVTTGTPGLGAIPIDAGTDGAHTLYVEWVANSPVVFGADLRTASEGVVVHQCGNGGARASTWITPNATCQQAAWTALAPDVTAVLLGTNDRTNGDVPATMKASLDTLTDRHATALPSTALVLMVPPQNGGAGTYPMSDYRDVIEDLATEEGHAYFSIHEVFDTYAVENARGMFSDTLHLSASGGQRVADALYRGLLSDR